MLDFNFIMLPVLSYLDPGSGSLLIQMLVAGFVGFTVFFRGSIKAVLSYFGIVQDKDEEEEDLESLVEEAK